MNKKQGIYERNKLVRQIRIGNRSGSHNGCVRIFPNNSYTHEKIKFDISYKLMKEGFEIYTEVIFENGKRADIVAIRNGVGYIVEVESPKPKKLTKKIEKKKNSIYPKDFSVRIVYTNDFNIDEFKL